MIGRDASESIRSGRSCKTSHGESCGRRTENPLPSGMGSRQAAKDERSVTDIQRGLDGTTASAAAYKKKHDGNDGPDRP